MQEPGKPRWCPHSPPTRSLFFKQLLYLKCDLVYYSLTMRPGLICSVTLMFVIRCAPFTSSAVAQISKDQSLHGVKTEDFLATCKKGLSAIDLNKDANFTYCEGFIAGIADARSLVHSAGAELCVPSSVTATQMVKIVEKYGDDHPEDLHLPSATFVAKALLRVYTCKQQ